MAVTQRKSGQLQRMIHPLRSLLYIHLTSRLPSAGLETWVSLEGIAVSFACVRSSGGGGGGGGGASSGNYNSSDVSSMGGGSGGGGGGGHSCSNSIAGHTLWFFM